MRQVRQLPAVDKRVETGAVQFGDDWPGLFIRGDNCIAVSFGVQMIEMCRDRFSDVEWITIRQMLNKLKCIPEDVHGVVAPGVADEVPESEGDE